MPDNIPGLYGHCLTQVLIDRDGVPYVIEINPRFGGASPLSLHAGSTQFVGSWKNLPAWRKKSPKFQKSILGSRLLKEDGEVRIIDPFPSRQKKSED